jgi:hypothetical protein
LDGVNSRSFRNVNNAHAVLAIHWLVLELNLTGSIFINKSFHQFFACVQQFRFTGWRHHAATGDSDILFWRKKKSQFNPKFPFITITSRWLSTWEK